MNNINHSPKKKEEKKLDMASGMLKVYAEDSITKIITTSTDGRKRIATRQLRLRYLFGRAAASGSGASPVFSRTVESASRFRFTGTLIRRNLIQFQLLFIVIN